MASEPPGKSLVGSPHGEPSLTAEIFFLVPEWLTSQRPTPVGGTSTGQCRRPEGVGLLLKPLCLWFGIAQVAAQVAAACDREAPPLKEAFGMLQVRLVDDQDALYWIR